MLTEERERSQKAFLQRGPEVRFKKTEERMTIQVWRVKVGVGEAGWLSVDSTQSVWR